MNENWSEKRHVQITACFLNCEPERGHVLLSSVFLPLLRHGNIVSLAVSCYPLFVVKTSNFGT